MLTNSFPKDSVFPLFFLVIFLITFKIFTFLPLLPVLIPILVQFSHSVMSDSLRPHGLQASLSITNSQGLLKLMSIDLVMPSNHLILCHPLLLPLQSFPASGSFQMSQLLPSGGRSTGVSASASVPPMNTQD